MKDMAMAAVIFGTQEWQKPRSKYKKKPKTNKQAKQKAKHQGSQAHTVSKIGNGRQSQNRRKLGNVKMENMRVRVLRTTTCSIGYSS